jgi:glycosyltransferase involved in cell wall biosynthesis
MPPEISVCIASYNGAPWIKEQIDSILSQLGPSDEIIVVDDNSTDNTVAVLESIPDPRLRIFQSPKNIGYVQNFGKAMKLARGKYVFLADQDDIWAPGRLEIMTAALREGAEVVAANLATLGGPDYVSGPYGQTDWHLRESDSTRNFRNLFGTLIGGMSYWGCAMGFRREILDVILPMPKYLAESHDLWLAIYGNLAKSIKHLEIRSLYWRNHASNTNPKKPRGPHWLIWKRWMMLRAIFHLHYRIARNTRLAKHQNAASVQPSLGV